MSEYPHFLALLLEEFLYGSPIGHHGERRKTMTFSQLIEQTRIERDEAAAQLRADHHYSEAGGADSYLPP
jgi:hypothetical protein